MKRIRQLFVHNAGMAATLVAAGASDDNTKAIVTDALALLTAAGVWVALDEPGRAA